MQCFRPKGLEALFASSRGSVQFLHIFPLDSRISCLQASFADPPGGWPSYIPRAHVCLIKPKDLYESGALREFSYSHSGNKQGGSSPLETGGGKCEDFS